MLAGPHHALWGTRTATLYLSVSVPTLQVVSHAAEKEHPASRLVPTVAPGVAISWPPGPSADLCQN